MVVLGSRGRLLTRAVAALLALGAALLASLVLPTKASAETYMVPITVTSSLGTYETVGTATAREIARPSYVRQCRRVRVRTRMGTWRRVVRCRYVRTLASATTETEITVVMAPTPVTSCVGELVTLGGTIKTLMHTTVHDDLSQTTVDQTNYQGVVGTATPSLGVTVRYTTQTMSKTTTHTDPLASVVISKSDNVHFIRAGETLAFDDTRTHFNTRIVDGVVQHVNVNGETCGVPTPEP